MVNVRYRLRNSVRCLQHCLDNDVPVVSRWDWLVFAIKALYLPLTKRK
jgi:hypothetical protein